MRGKMHGITFFIILLFLPWVLARAPHKDNRGIAHVLSEAEKDVTITQEDYLSYIRPITDGSEMVSISSKFPSEIVRFWRFVKNPQCWRPNPVDPRGEILKGVDCPRRLKIIDKNDPIRKCVGVVVEKRRARDGDLIFDLLPNKEYQYLINKSNIRMRKGGLHCEIVPDDTNRFENVFNQMKLNNVAEVEGIWVEDTNHENWRELHPVKSLRLVSKKRGD